MSGTSMDAVDVAVVAFPEQGIELLAYQQLSIPAGIKAAVRRLNGHSSIIEISSYDYRLAELFAQAVQKTLSQSHIDRTRIRAIGSHGQTILHLPDGDEPRSLQIGDPNLIAHRTGIATVADFRRMDMAAGGQGAPLAPAFHDWLFRRPGVERVVLNIGGIANLSILAADPEQPTSGFDTGPGNGLLDDWNQLHRHTEMDRDSDWAASGTVHQELLTRLLSSPYFKQPPPKSTGRDYFNLEWLGQHMGQISDAILPQDVQATLFELTCRNICDAIRHHAPGTEEIYVCGGGAHNKRLMQALELRLNDIELMDTGRLGLDPDAVEAVCFAWLAKRRLEETPGNCPGVTGASKEKILGGLYLP